MFNNNQLTTLKAILRERAKWCFVKAREEIKSNQSKERIEDFIEQGEFLFRMSY